MNSGEHKNMHIPCEPIPVRCTYEYPAIWIMRPNTEIDQQHVSTSNFPICSYEQQHILQNNWTFYRLHPHDSWIFFSLWQVGLSYSFFNVSFAFCEGSFSYLVSFIFSLKVDGLVWIRTKTTNIHPVVSLFWPFCAALASGNWSKGCNQAIRNIIYLRWGCSPAKQHCLSKVNHHSYVL